MVHSGVVFSYIVTIVGCTRYPVMEKLLFCFSASQPVETYVHGFGPPWGDGVVDESSGHGVVDLYWRRWLQMAHRDVRVAGGDGFAEIDIDETKLGLIGGYHDGFDDLGNGEDIPIFGRIAGVFGEGKISADVAARLGFR